jgi:peroxiredoxin
METGSYIVYFFNRYGTKLKDSTQFADSLMDARKLGAEVLAGAEGFDRTHKPVSFAVDRRIYNSLDSQD